MFELFVVKLNWIIWNTHSQFYQFIFSLSTKVNLGNMYAQGLGVEKDLEQARYYYQLAAPNNKNAQLLLEELDMDEKKKIESEEGKWDVFWIFVSITEDFLSWLFHISCLVNRVLSFVLVTERFISRFFCILKLGSKKAARVVMEKMIEEFLLHHNMNFIKYSAMIYFWRNNKFISIFILWLYMTSERRKI